MKHAIAGAACIVLACIAASANAAELPKLRPGMWEYTRIVQGAGAGGKDVNLKNEKCTDPNVDMKAQRSGLEKIGCKFSEVTQSGKKYEFSSECPVQGAVVRSTTVITVESEDAYSVQVTSTGGGHSSKEELHAKRTGDCAVK